MSASLKQVGWMATVAGGCLLIMAGCRTAAHTTLTISAAASLRESLGEVESSYRAAHPEVEFRENFGSSGALASQIEQGAPVDVVVTASAKTMGELASKGMLVKGTLAVLLRNSLVLIAPRDSRLEDFAGLTESGVRVIALGDPASVPAGQYGQQTLSALGLMEKVQRKIVLAQDVRQVLAYVETGNADAGLVYATDAETSGKVRVVAVAPEGSHGAIEYPAALIEGRPNVEASQAFLRYLSGPEARAIFLKHGFTIAAP